MAVRAPKTSAPSHALPFPSLRAGLPSIVGVNVALVLGLYGAALTGVESLPLVGVLACLGGVALATHRLAQAGLRHRAALSMVLRAGRAPIVASCGAAIGALMLLVALQPASSVTLANTWTAVAVATVAGLATTRFLKNRGRGPLDPAELIDVRYRDATVAVAGVGDVWFAPRIEALERDHPYRRFVVGLCIAYRELEADALPGPADERTAAAYVRRVLMPETAFSRLSGLPDNVLAERFNVPLEEVAERKLELGLITAG